METGEESSQEEEKGQSWEYYQARKETNSQIDEITIEYLLQSHKKWDILFDGQSFVQVRDRHKKNNKEVRTALNKYDTLETTLKDIADILIKETQKFMQDIKEPWKKIDERIDEWRNQFMQRDPAIREIELEKSLLAEDPEWNKCFRVYAQKWRNIEVERISETDSFFKIVISYRSENMKKQFENCCQELQDQIDGVAGGWKGMLRFVFSKFVLFRYNEQKGLLINPLSLTDFRLDIKSTQNDLVPSYPDKYTFLPRDLNIDVSQIQKQLPEDYIREMKQKGRISIEMQEQFSDNNSLVSEKELQRFKYFVLFFYYLQLADNEIKEPFTSQYAFVPQSVIEQAMPKLREKCFGIDDFLNQPQMKSLVEDFTNQLNFYDCKGPMIYGPPGTGKTHIIEKMIDLFDLQAIFQGNSSNFQGSLQGQGSRLLQVYFNRAKVIPWQPCALHIGEIEQLVKKKDDKSGGGGSPDVLNRLLELIEGTETIGNVKVFCTTNHVEMIEEAIRSRFSEIYLGKSNTVLRRDFVVWYLMRTKGKKDQQKGYFERITEAFFKKSCNEVQQPCNKECQYHFFLELKQVEEQKKLLAEAVLDIVYYTINFSTRQLKALLKSFISKILAKKLRFDSSPKEKLQAIKDFCQSQDEENFYFGRQLLPQLIFDQLELVNSRQQNNQQQRKNDFQKLLPDSLKYFLDAVKEEDLQSQQQQLQASGRVQLNFQHERLILFDMSAPQQELIQILKRRGLTNQKSELQHLAMSFYSQLQNVYLCDMEVYDGLETDYQKIYKEWQEWSERFEKNVYKQTIYICLKPDFIQKYNPEKREEYYKHPTDTLFFLQNELQTGMDDNKQSNKYQECVAPELKQIQAQENQLKAKQNEVVRKIDKDINLVFSRDNSHAISQIKDFIKLYKQQEDTASNKDQDQRQRGIDQQIYVEKLLKEYKEFLQSQEQYLIKELKLLLNEEELKVFKIEQLLDQSQFYKLEYCSLADTSKEFMQQLFSMLVINGDFSKVDYVNYHDCERNNAFEDINAFKGYISNLMKQGRSESKQLIVFELDDLLHIGPEEDAEIEKEYKEMALKIFQEFNKESSISSMWTIIITKKKSVLDLFYETVDKWPRTSKSAQKYQLERDKLKLVICSLCGNQFKEADEEDKCKAHEKDDFFIAEDQEKYKKFKDEWYNTHVPKYHEKGRHHHKHLASEKISEGCSFCDSLVKLYEKPSKVPFNDHKSNFANYDNNIYELNKVAFGKLRDAEILQDHLVYDKIEKFRYPVQKSIVDIKLQQKELFVNDVKRECCDGNYLKEECNPHKHRELKKGLNVKHIKEEIVEKIQQNILRAYKNNNE